MRITLTLLIPMLVSGHLCCFAEPIEKFFQSNAKLLLKKGAGEGPAWHPKLGLLFSGDGGINLVKLKYADVLRGAKVSGVPYAVDPRIQKVELDTNGKLSGNGGKK